MKTEQELIIKGLELLKDVLENPNDTRKLVLIEGWIEALTWVGTK